jgi:Uma2 family endonuclease
MATATTLMTEEEFLALPDDDGVDRELIRGELRERPTMTTRGFAHSIVMTRITSRLDVWASGRPAPRGVVVSGDARIRLRADSPSFVGAEIAYFAAESTPANPRRARFVDGPPVLAVEILSPSDGQEDVWDKVSLYLESGVPLVWIVDPFFSTVTVHRADAKPQLFNADQEITAEPFLPGFRAAVSDFFEGIGG